MRIATYNVWNSEQAMPRREVFLIEEMRKADADVLALQEVRSKEAAETMAVEAGYEHFCFYSYPEETEGLALFSRTPFLACGSWMDEAWAVYATTMIAGHILSVVNVHLPWNSEKERQRQIMAVEKRASELHAPWVYIMGDFNGNPSSDVQRFLEGECLLQGAEANPRWYDLAAAYGERINVKPEDTLNFQENPCFHGNTMETNARFDRILLRNPYPEKFPRLKMCAVFGKKVYDEIGLAASDHYGVVAELE